MVNRIITAEDQIQRVNNIIDKIENLQKLDYQLLTQRPHPKQWSAIEIIGHMNSAYLLYESRIDQKLQELPTQTTQEHGFKAGRTSAYFIKAITPQGSKRPMKMKTMKRFEPVFQLEDLDKDSIAGLFQQFFAYQKHLKAAIQACRSKTNKAGKIVSAIGPIVKFHLPEAFEFLIGHEERHLVQIDEALEMIR